MRFNSKHYPLLTKENWFKYQVSPSILNGNVVYKKESAKQRTIEWLKSAPLVIVENLRKLPLIPAYVSNLFAEASLANNSKLHDLYAKELLGVNYFYLYNGAIYLGVHGYASFVFFKNQLVAAGMFDDKKDQWWLFWNKEKKDGQTLVNDLIGFPASISLFKRYAEVKTKVLSPKKKIEDFHCKYKSDLDIPIELCTENWYTESLQTHPFMVRGHWRHQRHGKGLKDVKVIWIYEFWKKGHKHGAFKEKY